MSKVVITFPPEKAMSIRQQVLQSYRQLLRASRMAFGADRRTASAFRETVRQKMEGNRNLRDVAVIQTQIHEMVDAAMFMQDNLVQGLLNSRGNYGWFIPDRSVSDCTYLNLSPPHMAKITEVKLDDRHKKNMKEEEVLQAVDQAFLGKDVHIDHSCGGGKHKH